LASQSEYAWKKHLFLGKSFSASIALVANSHTPCEISFFENVATGFRNWMPIEPVVSGQLTTPCANHELLAKATLRWKYLKKIAVLCFVICSRVAVNSTKH